MSNDLKVLSIKSFSLGTSIFSAIQPVTSLTSLQLNLGLKSFKTLPANSLVNLVNLENVLLSGVCSTLSTGSIANLPSLASLTILNQLATIESNAINLLSSNVPQQTVINLSNNRLDNSSFQEDFLSANSSRTITLKVFQNFDLKTLPQSLRSFFNSNRENRLVLGSDTLVCGDCNSYWAVNELNGYRSQMEGVCRGSSSTSLWEYNWSKCKGSTSSSSPSFTNKVQWTILLCCFMMLTIMGSVSMY